jgi:hypothetical protein
MAIILLILSAGLTHARPDRIFSPQNRMADLPLMHGDSNAGLLMFAVPGSAPEPLARTAPGLSPGLPLQRTDQADGPAPALLVYVAFILIGSGLGIGMVRRNQRGL